MDLDGIRLLLRVVELGSVQRAAHLLGISRSALRRKLENLEAEVGSELLVRSATGVALTPAGAIVLAEGRTLLERFARMVSSAKASTGAAIGQLRLVVPVGIPDGPRIALLRALQVVAPGICLEEVECDEPLDRLGEPFDLMFHFGESPQRGSWFSRVLRRVRLMPLASPAYLEAHGRPASPAELAKHRVLGWTSGGSDPRQWPLWSGGTVAVEPVFCSQNGQMLHRAAQEGVGILLGDPEPTLLSGPTALLPVLHDQIGRELVFRCLSPMPGDANPRSRALLESIHSLLGRLAPGT